MSPSFCFILNGKDESDEKKESPACVTTVHKAVDDILSS